MNNDKATIEIDISDDEFCKIAKLAHERDITFNQMVELILLEEMERLKKQEGTIE